MVEECAGASTRDWADEQRPLAILDSWSWIASARAAARRAVEAGPAPEMQREDPADQRDAAVS